MTTEYTETGMELASLLFCDYIAAITKRPVGMRKSNLPQFTEPYITVLLSDFTPEKMDTSEFDFDDSHEGDICGENDDTYIRNDTELVRGLNILQFTVEALGGAADNDISRLQASFDSQQFVFGMEAFGFGLSDKGEAINTTSLLLENHFEKRFELKCSFYHCVNERFEMLWFDKAAIKLLVEKYNRIYEYDINVSKRLKCKGAICASYKP